MGLVRGCFRWVSRLLAVFALLLLAVDLILFFFLADILERRMAVIYTCGLAMGAWSMSTHPSDYPEPEGCRPYRVLTQQLSRRL